MPENDHAIARSHIDLEQRIRERAHQIWMARTHGHGSEGGALQDWLQAEQEVLADNDSTDAQNRATTVGNADAPDMSRIEELGEA